jgi:hypothetical protein
MVDLNSNILRDVMKADISLGNSGASNCWTRQMKDAFGSIPARIHRTAGGGFLHLCPIPREKLNWLKEPS